MTRLIRVPRRRLLPMRRVSVILGLEMLGLVRRAFAVPGHDLSSVESAASRAAGRPAGEAAGPAQARARCRRRFAFSLALRLLARIFWLDLTGCFT